MDHRYIVNHLLDWHRHQNNRELPWKGERDAYKIWLSEIILQQTRVEQGLKYYQKFIHKFPNVSSLASADENTVFKLWEGLGYYSRCRNLIGTAKRIHLEYHGVFPSEYTTILSLKGVGAYTAAAIASFGFHLPYAVVDGNVKRVLARFFKIELPIDSTEGVKKINELAQRLLPEDRPAEYNQAIMDFGAVVCKPARPLCTSCPLNKKCKAYRQGIVDVLPLKSRSLKIKTRYFNYFIIENGSRIYINKRTSKDIWQNLHEPVLIESDHLLTPGEIERNEHMEQFFLDQTFSIEHISTPAQQKLTHQKIIAQFIHVISRRELPGVLSARPMTSFAISKLAFPKIVASYLKDKNKSLNLTLV